jgi:hypothetical protein
MTKTAKLEVDYFENQDTKEVPFGFIYFTDGMRIGYSPGAEGTNEIGLFNAKQPYLLEKEGAELRARHIALATEFVKNVLARKTYKVTAVPEGEKFWVITIDGLPDSVSNVTQALREEGEQHIEIMARDFVALALEIDEKSFDLDIEIKEAQP